MRLDTWWWDKDNQNPVTNLKTNYQALDKSMKLIKNTSKRTIKAGQVVGYSNKKCTRVRAIKPITDAVEIMKRRYLITRWRRFKYQLCRLKPKLLAEKSQ